MTETGQDFLSLFNSLNKGWHIVRTARVELSICGGHSRMSCLPANGDKHANNGFISTAYNKGRLAQKNIKITVDPNHAEDH